MLTSQNVVGVHLASQTLGEDHLLVFFRKLSLQPGQLADRAGTTDQLEHTALKSG